MQIGASAFCFPDTKSRNYQANIAARVSLQGKFQTASADYDPSLKMQPVQPSPHRRNYCTTFAFPSYYTDLAIPYSVPRGVLSPAPTCPIDRPP